MVDNKPVAPRRRSLTQSRVRLNRHGPGEVPDAFSHNLYRGVSVPLPAEEMVRAVVGAGYDPSTASNVIKMLAGTEVMFQALIGMSGAITVAPIGA